MATPRIGVPGLTPGFNPIHLHVYTHSQSSWFLVAHVVGPYQGLGSWSQPGLALDIIGI